MKNQTELKNVLLSEPKPGVQLGYFFALLGQGTPCSSALSNGASQEGFSLRRAKMYCEDCYNLKVVKVKEFKQEHNTIRKLTVTCKANCWMTETGKQKTLFLHYQVNTRKNDRLRPFSIPKFKNVSRPCENRITDYTHEEREPISIAEARQILKKVLYA